MTTKSLVTIVIPVYNRAHTLPRLFASLKAQNYRPLEIIFVDNNSTDTSLDTCRRFSEASCEQDFEVRTLHEPTPGAAAARNHGLQHAKGEFISFFDSDDEMSPDFITRIMTVWQLCPQADFVVARSRMILENGIEVERSGLEYLSLHSQILSGALSTQSFVAKTTFMKRIGGWNAQLRFWDDYELGIRMLQHSESFIRIYHTFHRIYQHNDSITGASLSSTFSRMQDALPLIINQVLSPSSGMTTTKSCTALFYRLCILAGKLKGERHPQGAQWLETLAQRVSKQSESSLLTQMLGFMLKTYTAFGGRGAWRIAIMLLR